MELARIKAHNKAEKEKAKATALREKNRKREEKQALRAQIKAEKQKRRDTLKHETKKQRAKRIQEEKALRLEQKRIKQEKKQELKKQKFLARKQRKEQKQKNRQKNKERNRGFGGWLAAVISLGAACLILGTVLTFNLTVPSLSQGILETAYQKSFYSAIEEVENIDLNLSKILASKDGGATQSYLVDVAINAELAENEIQNLPLKDESKFYTTKLVNQIGDYAKYLNKKLIDGGEITVSERENLTSLYTANLTLKNSLASMSGNMNGTSFSQMAMGNFENDLVKGFEELQNLSVEYPELIYDGPFSDGRDNVNAKGLSGENASNKVALEKFNAYFFNYGLENVMNVGMLDGNIKCYNVQGEIDGDVLFAQISEIGGKLIMFSYSGSCNGINYEQDAAISLAEQFLNKTGIENVQAVWSNLANNVYTINFATKIDGVIVYPDLVKVRVCAETGMVIGLEAVEYYSNHTDRVIKSPKLTRAEALDKVSSRIEVETVRLAVVPLGQSAETLCYEFMGNYDGSTYYVYIDANSGRQVEMFKVVNGTEGQMMM